MGSFAHSADRRRAMRLAERAAGGSPDPLNYAATSPGLVQADTVGFSQVLASGINFDRAGFAYDVTGYGPVTVLGAGDATPRWSRVATLNSLRCPIGNVDQPIYIWIWATFGVSLDATATADHIRCVAVLYDSQNTANPPIVRANNPASNILKADGNFYEMAYVGFIGLDRADPVIAGLTTGDEDWNVGIDCQYSGTQKVSKTSFNRQSIIAFISAYPPDGSSNYTTDNFV